MTTDGDSLKSSCLLTETFPPPPGIAIEESESGASVTTAASSFATATPSLPPSALLALTAPPSGSAFEDEETPISRPARGVAAAAWAGAGMRAETGGLLT